MRKILIVDDEQKVYQLLQDLFDVTKGYETRTAATGEDGIRQAKAFCPDLIILDINMPGLSGLEVAQALQTDEATNSIPILFLSGLIDQKYSGMQIKDLGHFYAMSKPYEFNDMLAKIDTILKETG